MQSNEKLVAKIQSGNIGAINQLWEQCYGFIRNRAMKWFSAWKNRPDIDLDDLTQSGYIALCGAVSSFQSDKGCSFITYLDYYLKTEFAKATGCRTAAQLREPLNDAISIETPLGNDPDGMTVGDGIAANYTGIDSAEDAIYKEQIAAALDEAVKNLPAQQKRAIEGHYIHGMTYNEIAAQIGCSCSRVGQLVKSGLKELKNSKYAPTLSEMLYYERNYFRHTSLTAFKETGCSSPEWELLHKEKLLNR